MSNINMDAKIIKDDLLSENSKGGRLLDLYSYGNPLLYEIWPYYKIVGIDTNENLYDQNYYWKIHYLIGDLSSINFPPNFFDIITSIRLNRHTNNIEYLASKLSNILKPNGKLLLTFDRDYVNFLDEIIKKFENFNFIVKDIKKFDDFIFLKLELKKEIKEREINELYIYHPNIKGEGITEYTEILRKRLEKRGIKVFYGFAKTGSLQLVEYEDSLNIDLNQFEKNSFVEVHRKPTKTLREDLIYLTHVLPFNHSVSWYYVPHIAYEIDGVNMSKSKKYDWCSFGFSMVFKHYERIIFLRGKKKLVISINKFVPNRYYAYFLKALKLVSWNLDVKVKDYFTFDELVSELSECKAIVFFQDSKPQSSGTMRLAAALGVPVYAKDSYQARESQVIRFRSIKELKSPNIIRDSINVDDGLDYLLAVLKYHV